MNTEKEFSTKLREVISKSGYTLRELSPIVKASPGTISRWQNGHAVPAAAAQKSIISVVKAAKKKKKKKKKPYKRNSGLLCLDKMFANIDKREKLRRSKLTPEEDAKEEKKLKEWGERIAAISKVMEPVLKKLTKRLQAGEVTFDWNGHHRNRVTSPKVPKKYTYPYRRDFGPEEDVTDHLQTFRLLGTLEEAKNMSKATTEKPAYIGNIYNLICFDCGEKLDIKFDGEHLAVENPCEHPEGHPEYGEEINLPTGIIALSDVLLQHPSMGTDDRLEGHGIKWEKSGTSNAAAINIGRGYCGNSCPGVWVRHDKNEILIASSVFDEETDEQKEIEGYNCVGGICTDLWWWTLADVQTLEELEKEPDCTLSRQDVTTSVTPGKWKINQRYHLEDRDDYKTNTIFARITKVD